MLQPATSSGAIAVTTGVSVVASASTGYQLNSGVVTSVQCVAGSGAAGVVTLYDGSSTSGIMLVSLAAAEATVQTFNLGRGVVFSNGLYAVVSGTGTVGIVHYVVG